MSKMGKIAAVLAVSAAGVVFGSVGSPALAGPEQVSAPSAPCEPKEEISKHGNVTVQTISRRCSTTSRQESTSQGPAAKNRRVVESDPFEVAAGSRATRLSQACPRGQVVIGGGYDLRNSIFNEGNGAEFVLSSGANDRRTAWEVVAANPSEHDIEITVKAVCADRTQTQ